MRPTGSLRCTHSCGVQASLTNQGKPAIISEGLRPFGSGRRRWGRVSVGFSHGGCLQELGGHISPGHPATQRAGIQDVAPSTVPGRAHWEHTDEDMWKVAILAVRIHFVAKGCTAPTHQS